MTVASKGIKGLKFASESTSTSYEEKNPYEYCNDGNTSTEGVYINTLWMVPVKADGVTYDEKELVPAHISTLENRFFVEDLVGCIVLKDEAQVRLSDGRYRRRFTSLYWYPPKYSIDSKAPSSDKCERITYITDNYDRDYIFQDLKNNLKLGRRIRSDFEKAFEYQKLLSVAKEFDLEPPEVYL